VEEYWAKTQVVGQSYTHTHTHIYIAILGKMPHILENVSVFAKLELTKVAYWSGITLINLVFRYKINFKRKEKNTFKFKKKICL